MRLMGQADSYSSLGEAPIAFGRQSVLFAGQNSEGHRVCLKLYQTIRGTRLRWGPPAETSALMDVFQNEVRALQALKHPNILPLLDYGHVTPEATGNLRNIEAGMPFVVLPLCSRGDLDGALRARDFTPLDEALPVLRQLAAAIDHAHSSGYVHGDVKPQNVLFSDDGSTIFLSDFGLSSYSLFVEPASGSGEGPGTTMYLSPEQLTLNTRTSKSDLYALALVAYHMLVGELPWSGPTLFSVIAQKAVGYARDPLTLNPSMSRRTAAVLRWGLSTRPEDRPDSALAFCEALGSGRLGVEARSRLEPWLTATRDELLRGVSNSVQQRQGSRWSRLPTTSKATIITAVIAAVGGVLAALVSALF